MCNYGSNHYFAVVTANHGDKYGIKAYNTNTLYINDFTSTESSKYGVYANNNSYLDLETNPYYYPYKIANKTYALQLASYSEARLDYVRFDQNVYDIYAASTASAIACNCTITGQIYGDVIIDDPQWCGGYLKKQSGNGGAMSQNSGSVEFSISQGDLNVENNNSDFTEGLKIFRAIKKQVNADYASGKEYQPNKYLSDYQVAIDKFKRVVSEYPASIVNRALAYISWCYWDINKIDNLKSYLESLIEDNKYNRELKYHAKMLMASQNIHNREYDLALNQYDNVIQDCSTPDITVEAFYGKGILYLYYLNDNEKAAAVFKELTEKYPDHPTAEAAIDELENMDEGFFVSANESLPFELAIQIYPNPFNLETQIKFRNSERTVVNVSIYNSMGQLIKKLVNKSLPEGSHTFIWDGKNNAGQVIASGLYFCSLKTDKNSHTQKLLLVK